MRSVAFSPDGRLLATGDIASHARIWDVSTGKDQLKLMHGSFMSVMSVAFSPDGRLLATASSNKVRIWDASSGENRHTLVRGWIGRS